MIYLLVTCGGWLSSHSTSLSSAYCNVHDYAVIYLCVSVNYFWMEAKLYRVVLSHLFISVLSLNMKESKYNSDGGDYMQFLKKNKKTKNKKHQGISARSEFWKRTIDVRCLLTFSLKKNELWFETLLTCPISSNYLIEISRILFFEEEKHFLYLCLSSYNDKTEFYAMWKSSFLGIMST